MGLDKALIVVFASHPLLSIIGVLMRFLGKIVCGNKLCEKLHAALVS
jgi:hypothetical protein